MTLFSLYHDKGMSFAVLYCRNGIGNTAAVVVAVDDTMEEGRLLIISDGGSDGCSTTSLLLNNIDAAKENERNDFWNKAGKSIAAV
mmetsp:Transcript_17933/g.29389  ORF Transcript_17933/g.29389 Transcript_17933/m.29389 type:complete len:86 (+) Transcript_17933:629-886(+)